VGEGPGAYALTLAFVESSSRGDSLRGLAFPLSRRVRQKRVELVGSTENLRDCQQLKDSQAECLSKDLLDAPETREAFWIDLFRGEKRGRSSRDLP
jgi:hypothetical protein